MVSNMNLLKELKIYSCIIGLLVSFLTIGIVWGIPILAVTLFTLGIFAYMYVVHVATADAASYQMVH